LRENDVLTRLQEVFDRLFVDPPKLRMDLAAAEVPEWDSAKHVELVMAVEQAFGVNLPVGELLGIQQVGDLVKLLATTVG